MGDLGCSSGGVSSTGEVRRNGSSSLVKQDVVGDGSGAKWADQVRSLEIYQVIKPSSIVLEGMCGTADTDITSDRYVSYQQYLRSILRRLAPFDPVFPNIGENLESSAVR